MIKGLSPKANIGILFLFLNLPPTLNAEMATLTQADYAPIALASSVKDTDAHYSDNLIDGDTESLWDSGSDKTPQWVEIRWPYAQMPRMIELKGEETFKNWTILGWLEGEWSEITRQKDGNQVEFPSARLERLRIIFNEVPGSSLKINEIKVYGKGNRPLEKLRPYWSAKYIWYPEKDQRLVMDVPRYFRHSFHLDNLDDIKSAFIVSRSNDDYVAMLNGHEVARGSTNITPKNVKNFLCKGENVISYIATARSDPGWGMMELLGELIIYTDKERLTFGTDGQWLSHTEFEEGWNKPQAKLGDGWKSAAVIGAPPGVVWGEIPFPDPGLALQANMEQLKIEPRHAQPGDRIKVSGLFSLREKVPFPFQMEWKLGDQTVHPELGDFSIVSSFVQPEPQITDWEPNKKYLVEAEFTLPKWTPSGRIPLTIRGVSMDGQNRSLVVNGAGIQEPLGYLNVTREEQIKLLSPGKGGSVIRSGQLAGIRVGENVLPPVFFGATTHWTYRKIYDYARTGVKIFELRMPALISSDKDAYNRGFQAFDRQARHILSLVPDARIMLLADLRPGVDWIMDNPEGLMRDAFGRPLAPSVVSKKFRESAANFVQILADFIKATPYKDQISGFRFIIGAQQDANIGGVQSNIGQMDRSQWTIGDWNSDAIVGFRDFLREHYNNDLDALRKAWRDEKVTFENASVSPQTIVSSLPKDNLFRNPKEEGFSAIDYCAYISSMIPESYTKIVSDTIRKNFGEDMLVLNWSGYMVQNFCGTPPASVQQNNGFWYQHNNYNLSNDVFTGTTDYETRQPGFRMNSFQPLDSLSWHKRLGIVEIDYRTFVAGPKIHGRQLSQDESIAVLRREMGSSIIHGGGYYFWEFTGTGKGRPGIGYFDDDSLQKTIKVSNETIQKALNEGRKPKSTAEIAVIFSVETPWFLDIAYPAALCYPLVTDMVYRELAKIGAPIDILQVNDLENTAAMEQYKLIIFANTWYLSPKQKKLVQDLQSNNRTLLWLYAPGYVDEGEGLSTRSMSELTGMNIEVIEGRQTPQFYTGDEKHAVLKNISSGTEITVPPLGSSYNFNKIMPTDVYPNFSVNDGDVQALGSDQEGRIRFAAKKLENWRSIYSSVPNLTTSIIRNIAEDAGVHLYASEGIVVEANSDYLLIHGNGLHLQRTEIRLPEARDVSSIYGNYEASNVKNFVIDLPEGPFTEMYELKSP